jgi:hypothetical protein
MTEGIQPKWRRSSRSTSENCVEVANLVLQIGVRDSKDPEGPALSFDAGVWRAFTRRVKAGAHDLA